MGEFLSSEYLRMGEFLSYDDDLYMGDKTSSAAKVDEGKPLKKIKIDVLRRAEDVKVKLPSADVPVIGKQSRAGQVNPIRIVDTDGNFNINFEKKLNLAAESRPMAVVSILGPVCSGKSTLLNHLFGTKFEEIDASKGCPQTTRGMWATKIKSAQDCILVIDTESILTENIRSVKQMIHFALAISDIVIINMRSSDVDGMISTAEAIRPLIKTVLKAMLRKFHTPHKVILQFVLRDNVTIPEDIRKRQVKERVHKMWEKMHDPQSNTNAALENYFKIEVVALSNYRYRKEQFKNEVARLNGQLRSYLAHDEHATQRITASCFAEYARNIWKEIWKNKTVDLLECRVLTAEFRRIIQEAGKNFHQNQTWLKIKEDVESGVVVQGFGEKVNLLVQTYLEEYDNALRADEITRDIRKKKLIGTLLRVIEPTYIRVLEEARHGAFKGFKKAVDNGLKKEKGILEVIAIVGYTQDYLNELDKRFADAFIEHSNWNHKAEQHYMFWHDAHAYLDGEMRKRLRHFKDTDPQGWTKFAMKFESVGLDPFTLVIKVFNLYLPIRPDFNLYMPIRPWATGDDMGNLSADDMDNLSAKDMGNLSADDMDNLSADDMDNLSAACKAVQFILDYMELLCDQGSISKDIIVSFCEDIKLIGCFLSSMQETSTDVSLPYVADIDKILLGVETMVGLMSFHQIIHLFLPTTVVRRLAQRIRSCEFLGLTDSQGKSSSKIDENSSVDRNIVIGLEHEARELQDKLTHGSKQLQVISIVGMPGIGKTTLARKLFNDSSVGHHFHAHAWVCVSQVYEKRKVLYRILKSILSREDPVFRMGVEDIGNKLYKCLKGHKYLIVIDDIWDIEVWNELKIYFPTDGNSSRILITSRIEDVALKVGQNSFIHHLRSRTEEESLDLFNCKVFGHKSCPLELREMAKSIVAKCKGLPLAIVVIAGFLIGEKTNEKCWKQVHDNIGSFISSNSKEFMDTLELSFKHLPSKLKSCFLYMGSFPEDSNIPVRRLLQSWIAEGFIQEIDEKRLEDIAEDYLMDLVNRNLVMVVSERSDGGIKSCNIHDMLRQLCLKKTGQKIFVLPKCNCGPNAAPIDEHARLLMFKGCFPHFSYCQYFHTCNFLNVSKDMVFNQETLAAYKYLNTLDLRHIILDSFPDQILELHHLRYLALHLANIKVLSPMLFKLWNLETCILGGETGGKIMLPCAIFKMKKLRHLKISQELYLQNPRKCSTRGQSGTCLQCFQIELSQQHEATGMEIMEDHGSHSSSRRCLREIAASLSWRKDGILENLQSLSQICPASFVEKLLERTPNLRKLGLHLTLSEGDDNFSFPDLSHLDKLEALKFEYQTFGMVPWSFPNPVMFPPSLKKLTLIGSHVNWKEMSILELLPSLEVLKIKDNFFNGPQWETSDYGFPCLKFLKLSHMDLQEWISSSSHFPSLEKLVLNGCLKLKEIPSEIGEIPTLQIIQVYRSSESSMESARQIQESNIDMGNYDFKVDIFHHFEEY